VPANRYLPIYLRDHHAAAQAGRALARRASANAENRQLRTLVERIESDALTLESVMATLDVVPSRIKDGLAVAGERLGRLKPNGDLHGSSPLGRVLELELLVAGIAAKAALWRSLAAASDPRLDSFDFDALARSAEEQRQEAEACRVEAAARAFRA
jgi:hypothetical protein